MPACLRHGQADARHVPSDVWQYRRRIRIQESPTAKYARGRLSSAYNHHRGSVCAAIMCLRRQYLAVSGSPSAERLDISPLHHAGGKTASGERKFPLERGKGVGAPRNMWPPNSPSPIRLSDSTITRLGHSEVCVGRRTDIRPSCAWWRRAPPSGRREFPPLVGWQAA